MVCICWILSCGTYVFVGYDHVVQYLLDIIMWYVFVGYYHVVCICWILSCGMYLDIIMWYVFVGYYHVVQYLLAESHQLMQLCLETVINLYVSNAIYSYLDFYLKIVFIGYLDTCTHI